MPKIKVSQWELELLESIRNYIRAYPDGAAELEYYAQQLFDRLIELPQQGIKEIP